MMKLKIKVKSFRNRISTLINVPFAENIVLWLEEPQERVGNAEFLGAFFGRTDDLFWCV